MRGQNSMEELGNHTAGVAHQLQLQVEFGLLLAVLQLQLNDALEFGSLQLPQLLSFLVEGAYLSLHVLLLAHEGVLVFLPHFSNPETLSLIQLVELLFEDLHHFVD